MTYSQTSIAKLSRRRGGRGIDAATFLFITLLRLFSAQAAVIVSSKCIYFFSSGK